MKNNEVDLRDKDRETDEEFSSHMRELTEYSRWLNSPEESKESLDARFGRIRVNVTNFGKEHRRRKILRNLAISLTASLALIVGSSMYSIVSRQDEHKQALAENSKVVSKSPQAPIMFQRLVRSSQSGISRISKGEEALARINQSKSTIWFSRNGSDYTINIRPRGGEVEIYELDTNTGSQVVKQIVVDISKSGEIRHLFVVPKEGTPERYVGIE